MPILNSIKEYRAIKNKFDSEIEEKIDLDNITFDSLKKIKGLNDKEKQKEYEDVLNKFCSNLTYSTLTNEIMDFFIEIEYDCRKNFELDIMKDKFYMYSKITSLKKANNELESECDNLYKGVKIPSINNRSLALIDRILKEFGDSQLSELDYDRE